MFWQIRLKIFLILATIGAFGAGFHGLGDAMKFRHPVAITCAQLVSDHPEKGWYTISDGTLDLANSTPEDGTESAYYVPVKLTNPPPAPTPSSVVTSNSAGAAGLPAQPTGTGVTAYITDDATIKQIDAYNNSVKRPMTPHAELHSSDYAGITPQATLPVQVSGMIVSADSTSDNPTSSSQDSSDFDPDAVVIGLGTQPSVWKGFMMLGIGVILAFGVLWSFGVSPSISGTKNLIDTVKGGGYRGYNNSAPAPYGNVVPPTYNNQWQNQNQPSQQPGPYSQPGPYAQPGQQYPAATPSNAWSPTGQDDPYAQRPAQPSNPYAQNPAPQNNPYTQNPPAQSKQAPAAPWIPQAGIKSDDSPK